MRNIFMNKKVWVGVFIVWIVFSVGYVTYDQWNDFQVNQIERAKSIGKTDAIKALVAEVAKCGAVPLLNGEDKKEVVAIECLQQASEDAKKNAKLQADQEAKERAAKVQREKEEAEAEAAAQRARDAAENNDEN